MSETVMHLVLEDGAREEDQEADLLNVLHLPRVVHLAHLPTHVAQARIRGLEGGS